MCLSYSESQWVQYSRSFKEIELCQMSPGSAPLLCHLYDSGQTTHALSRHFPTCKGTFTSKSAARIRGTGPSTRRALRERHCHSRVFTDLNNDVCWCSREATSHLPTRPEQPSRFSWHSKAAVCVSCLHWLRASW